MRWECRYSSCEMMYLELRPDEVISYLDHSPHRADRYSFADVLNGKLDGEVRAVFGEETLEQVKAAVRQRLGARAF